MRRTWFDPWLIAVVTCAATVWAFWVPSHTQDEVTLLLHADLVARGRVPNRDFFTPYGPGTFWPLAGLFSITGGPSVLGGRAVGLMYHALLATSLWGLLRHRGRGIALAAGALAGLLATGLLLTPYGWLLALAMTIWSAAAGINHRYVLAGAAAAIAVSVRPEFLVLVTAVAALTLRPRGGLLRFVAGAVVAAIPMSIHVALAGGDLFRNLVRDRLTTDTGLPLPPDAVPLSLTLLLVGLILIFVTYRTVRLGGRSRWVILALCWLVVPQLLQRADTEHALFVLVLVAPVGMAELVTLMPSRAGRAAQTMAVVAIAIIGLAGAALATVVPRPAEARVGDRTLFARSQSEAEIQERVARKVRDRLEPGESLFVGLTDMSYAGINATFIYYLLPEHIPDDVYYLDLAPGVSERAGSALLRDVSRAELLALTSFPRSQGRSLFPFLPRGSGRVNQYVRDHFCLVEVIGAFEIHERCR